MAPSGRVTIADVAAASGFGVGTVSRVINSAPNVRDSTRDTVLAVIKKLGYRPSYLAVSLSRGTPQTIAIMVPHLTAPSAVMRLAGALTVLDEQGYDTVVCNVDTPGQRDHHLTALTSRYRVDGVIVVSLPLSRQWLASFRRAEVPLVAVDVAFKGIPHTVSDDVAGGRMATEHLISLGHRRIGFVGDTRRPAEGTDLGFTASHKRLCGYGEALQHAGVEYNATLVRRGPHGSANAEALAVELLSMPEPPTAVFAASDTQAMGVLAAADRAGRAVPGELSVIGFDDIESAMLLGLTTVHQPLEVSGAEAARRLCTLLRGEPIGPLRQQLSLKVVHRSSTARPRGSAPLQTGAHPGDAALLPEGSTAGTI
jgi:DNA-binding LacI/PurR family transcriptional regulator